MASSTKTKTKAPAPKAQAKTKAQAPGLPASLTPYQANTLRRAPFNTAKIIAPTIARGLLTKAKCSSLPHQASTIYLQATPLYLQAQGIKRAYLFALTPAKLLRPDYGQLASILMAGAAPQGASFTTAYQASLKTKAKAPKASTKAQASTKATSTKAKAQAPTKAPAQAKAPARPQAPTKLGQALIAKTARAAQAQASRAQAKAQARQAKATAPGTRRPAKAQGAGRGL